MAHATLPSADEALAKAPLPAAAGPHADAGTVKTCSCEAFVAASGHSYAASGSGDCGAGAPVKAPPCSAGHGCGAQPKSAPGVGAKTLDEEEAKLAAAAAKLRQRLQHLDAARELILI
jgi:hypothetical protein